MILIRRLQSFAYALQGLAFLLRTQPNARVHLLAALLVCAAGVYFGLSRAEWLWVVAAIVLVWSAEAFNTALELLADALHPEWHPAIGRAKDMAAAAVLIVAVGAAVIGMLVFVPHLASMGQRAFAASVPCLIP
ncbi:diacylglycerol kinase family protein [Thiobacillus sp.]